MLSYFQVFETSTSQKENHLIDYDKTVALNEECFAVGQNCKKKYKKMSTALSIPRRSPIQVLTQPNVA